MHFQAIKQMTKMLRNLEKWLEAAEAHAQKKGFDKAVLLAARLAPDQYALLRQVQAACDAAKFAGARLANKEPPKHPDTEHTWEEIRARIGSATGWLETLTEKDFAGAGDRVVPLPFIQGKGLKGDDYLLQMAMPNFMFHVTTAYAILRHNGVDLGKRDYIGPIDLLDV